MISEDELQVIADLRKLASAHGCMIYVRTNYFGRSIIFAKCPIEYIGFIMFTSFDQFYDVIDNNDQYEICAEVDISNCSTWEEIGVKVDLANLK